MGSARLFDKDAWILRALDAGALRVLSDGSIWRPGARHIERVPFSEHKKSGRLYFNLTFEGITKSVLVNRVVALALIPNPDNLPEVNHCDGDVKNNHPDNLEWSNRKHQEKHAQRLGLKANRGSANANAKLTAEQVLKIREAPADTLAQLAISLSVTRKTIEDIRSRKTWNHI